MATIHSFEELEVWKKAQEYGALIFALCNSNPMISKDFSFKDQIKRAALSVSNNIAEGFEYNNNNDFYRFLRIAKGLCGEVRNCLIFSTKVGYTDRSQIQNQIQCFDSLGRQIGKLMAYINTKRIKPDASKKPANPQPATRNL